MIWGAMSSAGVGSLSFLKTNVTAPVYQEMLEHFMLPSADQLFKDVSKNITIKRTKDLNYVSLCALNLFNTRVSQLELNY